MLLNSPDAGMSPSSTQMVFDVSTQDFEDKVMRASMNVPVIVDFWAPWCGPCKQLLPVLEQIVRAAGGRVLLAKVNIDECPELAQALRVQSVPTVFGFFQGQPVEAFMGAQPQSKLQEFVTKLITIANNSQPDSIDIDAALKEAASELSEGDSAAAYALYMQVLQQDQLNASAYAGMVRCFIAMGQLDQAQNMMDNAPEPIAKHSDFLATKSAFELAQKKPVTNLQAFIDQIEANPNDHQARIDLAYALFAAGEKKEACDALLASIEIDPEWNDQAARTELLTLFKAMGNADPITLKSRRKLSSLLFS